MKTYEEAVKEILDIPRFAGKNSPQDTRRLLHMVIGEEPGGKVIHVAGTNGKGSVCAYLRSILTESGLRIGMFTSPHLVTMRERICIDNDMISEQDFVRVYRAVKETVHDAISQGMTHPSFFEFLFMMAMLYFQEQELDYIILETGLGGRLDATNSIDKPKVCVITEIGFDHMQYLGNTLEEIAGEKAGIMKAGIPVVFMDKRHEVTEVLTEYAEKVKSPAIIVKKHQILDVNIHNKSIDFSLHTGYYNYISLLLDTVAVYQTENASLAICAIELLHEKSITQEKIKAGLAKAHWPGRMEEVCRDTYLDGAHNEDGIEAFLETVAHIPCSGRRRLLFGVVEDKRYEQMIQRIAESELFCEVAVTELESNRSVSANRLREIWRQYKGITCSFHESAEEAYQYLSSEKKEGDIIYIAGSLYLVGQIQALIRRMPDD